MNSPTDQRLAREFNPQEMANTVWAFVTSRLGHPSERSLATYFERNRVAIRPRGRLLPVVRLGRQRPDRHQHRRRRQGHQPEQPRRSRTTANAFLRFLCPPASEPRRIYFEMIPSVSLTNQQSSAFLPYLRKAKGTWKKFTKTLDGRKTKLQL